MDQVIGCKKTIKTPVGQLALFSTTKGLSKVEFLDSKAKSIDFSSDSIATKHCDDAAMWLEKYFSGSESQYKGTLDLAGTNFQRAVWEQIAEIDFGNTRSYGEIANAIGKPQASRAVGAAVGANPVPLVIPCHRVMGVGGRITGYSGGEGIPTKRQLLRHESIGFRD